MDTSDQLIADYKTRKELEKQDSDTQKDLVGQRLIEAYEKGLPIWFGEFAKEIVVDPEKPGEFVYRPVDDRYDYDACITLDFMWRSIKGKIYAMAVSKERKARGRCTATFQLFFDTEYLFGK